MSVKLRLTRMGKKKQPFYRIVATDSRTRRDGKYLEKIGYYNPLTNPSEVVIDEEKAFYWLKNGAIPSNTVKNLLSEKGIMLKWHFMKHGLDEAKIDEEYKKWELLQFEKQKRNEALAAQAKREEETATAEQPEPEVKEAAAPEKKEAAAPEKKEAAALEKKEEESTEKMEESGTTQSKDQTQKQNEQEEAQTEDQASEVQQAEQPVDAKDK